MAKSFGAIGAFAQKKLDLFHALRALHQARGLPDPNPHAEPGGQPDYTWLAPPYGGFIEVKDGDGNFSFADIRPKQREWLDAWASVSWLWLFMGHGRAGSLDRAAYLIDWPAWLAVEGQARAHGLAGLAWRSPHQRQHRLAGLCIAQLCAEHALDWAGAGVWRIPPAHAFWRLPPARADLFHRFRDHPPPEKPAHDRRPPRPAGRAGARSAPVARVAAES